MNTLCLAPLILAAGSDVVKPDSGEIPAVAPGLADKVAPALAPERSFEGSDGGVADPTLTVYKVDLPIEAAVTAASAGLYVFVDYLIKPTLEGDVSCAARANGHCDPARLSSFDRYSVGRHSKEWRAFSDVALVAAMALPVLYLGFESIGLPTVSPWRDFANDLLIVAESLSLAGAFQTVLKFAVRRPRPDWYDANEDLTNIPFDSGLSFPSGHTMLVASATTALTMTIFLRHPTAPLRWIVLGAGAVLTGMTALARVEAGAHFPTDVIVATFLGAFTGFIVPYLHKKELPVLPVGGINPIDGSGSIGVQGRF